MELSQNSYQDSLDKIQKILLHTQQKLNYEKIVMCWEIGKIIHEHLSQSKGSNYGNKFFEQLTHDTSISKSSLYQMQNFYHAYPTLPEPTTTLNWSQYRHLATIKDQRSRKSLELTALRNNLSANELLKEIKHKKHVQKTPNQGYSQLKYQRGTLFTYRITDLGDKHKIFMDFGFNIFGEAINQDFKDSDIVRSISHNGQFKLEKQSIEKRRLHTYKAYINKIVDGDTINVILDLGFNIRHKEIIRLAHINAPEKNTQAGEKATKKLQNILKNVDFIIIKTNKTDIYGRYVGDVFFSPQNDQSPQNVADSGTYLNQMLLDLAVVESY